MKLLVSGGGTAGHVFPAIAVIESIKEELPEVEISYAGTKKFEKEKAANLGISFIEFKVKGFSRRLSLSSAEAILRALRETLKAYRILKKEKFDVVFITGGYVSFPAAAAARLLGIPLFIHEQNSNPGMVNSLFSRYSKKFFVSFPVHGKPESEKVVFTGNPVRKSVIGKDVKKAAELFNLDPSRKTLLVFGGSQGAKSINEAVFQSLKILDSEQKTKRIQVIHSIGSMHFDKFKIEAEKISKTLNNIDYRYFENIGEMGYAYALSDLSVCRAGATTIAELAITTTPAILIPYPYATGDHQQKNAEYVESRDAAVTIKDEELSGNNLAGRVKEILFSPKKLNEMKENLKLLGKPDAKDKIASIIISELLKRE